MTTPGSVVDPIDIGKVTTPPEIRLPDPKLIFTHRAARFSALAPESGIGDFLAFMAELARAQSTALERFPASFLPRAAAMQDAHRNGRPPLDRSRLRRDFSWMSALRTILDRMDNAALAPQARRAIGTLRELDAGALDVLADRATHFDEDNIDSAQACFLVAALQVYWTRTAALLNPEDVKQVKPVGACPVCAAPPVASIVYSTGSLTGARFLVCSLCAAEWHLVRIKCANCDSTKGIAYQGIEGGKGLIKAETCDQCRTYTKILYTEKDRSAEPFADDLATIGLDVLVNEAGWQRAKPNPFLIPGPG